MILFLLAYLGGVLTILSPCILPVLPFVFASSDRPFLRSGLPMLFGMALTFAAVATLAAVGGGWAVRANEFGRDAALGLLALFGAALLLPSLADWLARPLVAWGGNLSRMQDASIASSLLLGVATGLLWAPCAGPVLGLILTGAALQGASLGTSLLLLAYALGAATSLALALLIGGRVFHVMKRSLGVGQWVRRGLGAAVLVAVGVIACGFDTGLLARASLAKTTILEQNLVDRLGAETPPASGAALPVEGELPSLTGVTEWLNTPPLTPQQLRGKVVLVDFWTYSCINCLRSLPYVQAWAQKYKERGLVVIGVHAPEFAFEKSLANVKKAVADLHIDYPVAIDNDYALWRAFGNHYWPAHYFIDAQGRIRHHHFGEGQTEESENVIRQLLAETDKTALPPSSLPQTVPPVAASGAEQAADAADVASPETYIGADRAEGFVSPGGVVRDKSQHYTSGTPKLNEWGLQGDWSVSGEQAVLDHAEGSIVYRFHARDLHLVLGPAPDGKPVRFRVSIDGSAPGANHGVDTDADGQGVVTGHRLYQLIRQHGAIGDHTFEIRFLDPGASAYAFTFG